MASGLYVRAKFNGDNTSDELIGLDLNLSSTACLPYPSSFSTLKENSASWVIPFIDETRNHKRLKQQHSANYEFNNAGTNYYSLYSGCGSMSARGLESLPRIHFKDDISAYTRRYFAVEAMEQAAATLMRGKEDESEEGRSGDGTKLAQRLIDCAEAVACCDKVHASALLYELRLAQVSGTSFQRVASCFVQGLSDFLVVVQPLRAVGVLGPMTKSIAFSAEKDRMKLYTLYMRFSLKSNSVTS